MSTSSSKIIISFVVLIGIGLGIVAFATISVENNQQIVSNDIEIIKHDEIISIGTVGDNAEKLIKRFTPTANYLAQKLSDDDLIFNGKVIITADLEEM